MSRTALALALPLAASLAALVPGCTVNTTSVPPAPPPDSARGMGEHNAPVAGAGMLMRTALNQAFCVDAAGDRAAEATPVTLYNCTGKENQRWTFSDQPGGEITITGIGGLCLDSRDQHSQLWPCDNLKNQKFRHESDGRMREAATGKCLTVASARDGAQLALDECDRNNGGKVWVVAR